MSTVSQGHEEKRDFIRMRIDSEASLLHAGEVVSAVCIDLSASGLQVQAPRRFAVGDQVDVSIESEHASLSGLQARAEVVWVADQGVGEQRVGLKIVAMH
ncbi:PilZ domain-containing protein [Pseudomonas entomophila]|uniref:PilZ domain-containing protein n=1 Tax=Pseudomonas entomophila TaxID=312306 RepID=UPI003EC03F5D